MVASWRASLPWWNRARLRGDILPGRFWINKTGVYRANKQLSQPLDLALGRLLVTQDPGV
jgi:hypothetical protein